MVWQLSSDIHYHSLYSGQTVIKFQKSKIYEVYLLPFETTQSLTMWPMGHQWDHICFSGN